MEKYRRARQATADDMTRAHFMLDTKDSRHAVRIYCIILIAFPLQQWLQECAAMLRYTYISSLVATVNL